MKITLLLLAATILLVVGLIIAGAVIANEWLIPYMKEHLP
jgi:hypothetical protein